MGILSKILQTQEQRDAEEERELIRLESQIGRQIFGKVPEGHNREFFCLDESTWVWHEDWTDKTGKKITLSTRYNVRPSGIIKSVNGQHYQQLDNEEKQHLVTAIRHYVRRVTSEYDKILQTQTA